MTGSPALTVIGGFTYGAQSQFFGRWFLPAYQASYRWTGNRWDAEDATTWIFMKAMGCVELPQLVSVMDECVADAILEAASRHWHDRYGIALLRCREMAAREADLVGRPPLTLDALVSGLSPEMRLVIVLRFLRKRRLSAIAAQLGIRPAAAAAYLHSALSTVAERMGFDPGKGGMQADKVAAYVSDLVGRRKPLRFEAMPAAWSALLAATHIQAAVAGNDIPRHGFVRSLEETFEAGGSSRPRRHVTHLRIWTA